MKTDKQGASDSIDGTDSSTATAPAIKAKSAAEIKTTDSAPVKLDLSKFTVLVVEDNEINQEIIVRMLQAAGCTVKVAEDGFEAIIYYFEFQPDIVLMDIYMPDVDGVAALKAIRNQGGVAPIFAVTANVTKDEVKAYLAAGFNDIIAKPIIREILIKKISRALVA